MSIELDIIYEPWPVEETFDNNFILQYDLKDTSAIPFRVIQISGEDLQTNEKTVSIYYEGEIWFDGVRHSYMGSVYNMNESLDGYMHYISLKTMSSILLRLHELCLKYCSCYDKSDY